MQRGDRDEPELEDIREDEEVQRAAVSSKTTSPIIR